MPYGFATDTVERSIVVCDSLMFIIRDYRPRIYLISSKYKKVLPM